MIQFYTFVTEVLKLRDDVFFTWMLPRFVTEEDAKWLPKHPNIRYVPVDQHRDRMFEYVKVGREVLELVSFTGGAWDYDVLLTVRTGMVPTYKMNAISPRQASMPWTKEVWVIEEMPLMEFKKSVATVNPDAQDLYTMAGYLAANRVFIISHHEKAQILQAAREWFPPSRVMQIDKTITEVVPVQKDDYSLKDKSAWYVPGQGKQFCISYVGRMMAAQSNLDKVYAAMTNHWIMQGSDNVRLLVLTVSTGGQAAWPPSHIEVQHAPREEFWRISREDMHVLVIMHQDGGFSLSLIEPMMMGVPAILLDAPWARKLLGDEYPFFVKSELEVYTMLKMFYEDYAGMYAKFAAYFVGSFVPLFKERFKDQLLYTHLIDNTIRAEKDIVGTYREKTKNREPNVIITELLKFVGKKKEFVLLDALKQMGMDGVLKTLQRKLSDTDKETRGMVWQTPWNDFRLNLKANHGWVDASPELGHLKKVK